LGRAAEFLGDRAKDFKPVESPMGLQARNQPNAPVRREKCACGIVFERPAATETVLYTAHYDQLGVDPDRNGRNIFSGGVDNATGCAVLLELARTWSQTTKAPYA